MYFSIIFLVTICVLTICACIIRFRYPKYSSLTDEKVKEMYQMAMIKK